MTELRHILSNAGMVSLAPSKLIASDGFVGVFTPIAEQGTASSEGTRNLEEIVDRLTTEIGALQEKNVQLQSRLDRVLAPATSSDDLASALQRTVNRLQTELASLSNPISNFAVKDFRLETSLTVGITELGSVEFRMLQPGANVDPAAVSRLTLSLVPIEKQRVDGTFATALFEPDKELSAIGVNAPLRELLERNHIFTIGEFRTAAMRAQVRASLIASERTTQAELARLQARAELVLLAGIDRDVADALIDASIDSLRALASCSAEGLGMILPRIEPARLARWIESAKTFIGKDAPGDDAQQHVVSLTTEPAGLIVRHGTREHFAASPLVRRIPAHEAVVLRTLRTQLHDGVAYVFERWSNDATSVVLTERPATNVTRSARFRTAGYWVHSASADEGGKVTLSPPAGGLPQLPASIFASGATVTVVAEPGKGYALRHVVISSGGKTRTVTTPTTPLVVNAPVKAFASFMARPAMISFISPPAAKGESFFSRVSFSSREPVPAFDVRVTAVRFQTTAGEGTVMLRGELPMIFGDVPIDGRTRELPLVYDIPKSVTAFNIFLTVQLRNATRDVFVDERSVGHRHPNL